jgi:hypothetical protein
MCVSVPIRPPPPLPISILNEVMSFHKSVYEHYATGRYNDVKNLIYYNN